jgi:hypothetical protein
VKKTGGNKNKETNLMKDKPTRIRVPKLKSSQRLTLKLIIGMQSLILIDS